MTKRSHTHQHWFWTPGPEQAACGLSLIACGHFDSRSHRLESRQLPELVIGIVADGHGRVRIGNRHHRITGPGIWVIPPLIDHGYQCDPDLGWDLYWLHATGAHVEAVLEHAGFSDQVPWRPINEATSLISSWQNLAVAVNAPQVTDGYQVMAALGQLLHQIPPHVRGSNDDHQAALGILDHRTNDLAPLAAAAHCSVPTYVKRFKRATGRTPWQYVLGRRLDRARALLAGSDLPIAEVSRESGFDDPDYFTRFIRQRLGCSPRAFRQRHREW